MLERMSSSEDQKHKPVNGEVLNDDVLDVHDDMYEYAEHLVDTGVATMGDAREMAGLPAAEYDEFSAEAIKARQPVEGVAMDLGKRAMLVNVILDGIAVQNMAQGANKAKSKDTSFVRRYVDPEAVAWALNDKAEGYRVRESDFVDAIIMEEELRAAGFSESDIITHEWEMRQEINEYRKTGPEARALRRKLKRKANAVSEKARRAVQDEEEDK